MSQATREAIPEDAVTAILARAAELDRTARDAVSVDVIRSAAIEAGIAPAAVDRALEELATGRRPDPVPPRPPAATTPPAPEPASRLSRWLRRIWGPVKMGLFTFVLGAAATAEDAAALFAWAVWILITAVLAFRARRRGEAGQFQLTTVVMAAAMLVGYGGAGGGPEGATIYLFTGIVLLVVGTGVATLGRPDRDR